MEDNKERSQENTTENTTENKESTIENKPTENNQAITEDTINQDTNTQTTSGTDSVGIKKKLKFPKINFSLSGIKKIYEEQYKKLLIIPFSLLLIAIILIGINFAITGDFVNRDVSLKGGITVTIPTSQQIDTVQLKNSISLSFPENDILTKSLSRFGNQIGIIVEADIEQSQLDDLIDAIGK